jgi:hypothetical protein
VTERLRHENKQRTWPAECQGRLNGEAPALTDAERKQRQRSREKAAQEDIERLRLAAEAKPK